MLHWLLLCLSNFLKINLFVSAPVNHKLNSVLHVWSFFSKVYKFVACHGSTCMSSVSKSVKTKDMNRATNRLFQMLLEAVLQVDPLLIPADRVTPPPINLPNCSDSAHISPIQAQCKRLCQYLAEIKVHFYAIVFSWATGLVALLKRGISWLNSFIKKNFNKWIKKSVEQSLFLACWNI